MDISKVIEDLKVDEGWDPSAYKDSLGFWTIGYGFLIDRSKGGEIPMPIAEAWLKHEATEKWNSLVAAQPWVLTQPENVQRALCNMCYQLGVSGVGKFKKMIAALKLGDRDKAADEALDSTWAKQTPNRAKKVTDIMRG